MWKGCGMSIRHTCGCGARIRLPESAAGRKARCKSCGAVFRVPQPAADGPPVQPDVANGSSPASGHAGAHPHEPGDWLQEFADTEAKAEGQPVRALDLSAPLAIESDDDLPRSGRPVIERSDRDPIIEPQRSFWADLAASFLFFLDGGNMVMFLVVILIGVWDALVSFAPLFISLIGHVVLNGYLCAFYMGTVLESASGEDELPGVSISNVFDDLFMPLVRFLGTWLIVLLPAFIAMMATLKGCDGPVDELEANWGLVTGLAVAGLAVWPVVVLGVAISGTLKGMLPHTAIRTILAAPLPYLAILATLVVAALIRVFAAEVPGWLGLPPTSGVVIGTAVLAVVAGVYSMIVAMRVIGLYYRHYKHRFPWTAE